jgi:cell wall-associated NlpC family hydrolase
MKSLLALLALTAAAFAQTAPIPSSAPSTQPEIRRGMPMSGTPEDRSRFFFDRLVKKAEPTGKADPARLPAYIFTLRHELSDDPRLIAFYPQAEMSGDTVVLSGFTEYPELKDSAVRFLKAIGFAKVEDKMQVLPEDFGTRPYAIVTSPKAFFYDKPASPHERVTQALPGDAIYLLKEDGDYYLAHSAEGYLGYVLASDVRRVDPAAFLAYQTGYQATVLRDTGDGDSYLPEGSHVHVIRSREEVAMVEMPDGTKVDMPAGRLRIRTDQPSEQVEKIIAAAMNMTGTRYVWGGRTADGVDCSGLVHAAFQTQGIVLPRDADQQALCGTLVATRGFRSALRRGDLLFFFAARGGIHHVAIYLGNDKYLEAAGKGVKVTSFKQSDENYDPRRDRSFAFAKRVLE